MYLIYGKFYNLLPSETRRVIDVPDNGIS